MADKKSILEEALLDIKNIQSALNANTKEILRSVAREEIDSVVKESILNEVGYTEEEAEETEIDDMGGEATGEPEANLDLDSSVDDTDVDTSNLDAIDSIDSSEVDSEMDSELGMDSLELGGDDMDMTGASDDDVIAIYKKLSGEDEIEVIGDEIHLNITEPGQYVIKAPTSVAPTGDDLGMDMDMDMDMDTEMDGGTELGMDVSYDIEMGDEEGGESEEEEVESEEGGNPFAADAADDTEEEEQEEEQLDEKIAIGIGMSVGGKANLGNNPKGAGADGDLISESQKLVTETKQRYNTLLTEAKKLKAENNEYKVQNNEFRAALKVFRKQIAETVVFNSNLTYATKLFMEHSTTKAEKENIFKRFDSEVSNITESQRLYKTIVNELATRKPMNESIENKIIKEVATSSSKQLNENTAYVDESTRRIIELMHHQNKK